MLIVALVLALIGLVSLVTAVVTSNELIAWVCIAASVLGVVLLIVDAIRDLLAGQPVGNELWFALAWCLGILVLAYVLAMAAYRRRIA